MNRTIAIRSAIFLFLVIGCSPATAFRSISTDLRPIQVGRVPDQNLRITAVDSSFTIEGAADFKPPFQMRATLVSDKSSLISSIGWREALELGARKVLVQRGREQFHGVLALMPALTTSRGPGASSYRIELPENYAKQARTGRVAFVGEYVQCAKGCATHWTWILWVSDAPFAG